MKLLLNTMLLSAMVLGVTACNQSNQTSTTNTTNASSPTASTSIPTNNQSQTQPATEKISIDTATGKRQIAVNPNPIAVYDLTVLQNLSSLEIPVQGLPNIPKPRAELLSLSAINTNSQPVGTLFEPNLEAINALKPQAVFIGSRMAEKGKALAEIAPTYDLSINTQDVYQSSRQQITTLGNIFNKSELAKQRLGELDQAINTAKQAVANKGNGLMVMVNGNKLSAYGANSRFGYLHNTFGIPQATADIRESSHGQPISFEFIQKVNPDWLIVLDRASAIGQEGASAQTVLNNPLVQSTKAWQNNHVIYLSADSYLAFGGYYQLLKDSKIVTDAFNKAK